MANKTEFKAQLNRGVPKLRLALTFVSAITVFLILNLAAWYNLRHHHNVCRRQSGTQLRLRTVAKGIKNHQNENHSLPGTLDEVTGIYRKDEWGNSLQYRQVGGGFELFSFGRDGQQGGNGLDADLYSDRRDDVDSPATLLQFFGENDSAEVERNRFLVAGFAAACMVGYLTFSGLSEAEYSRNPVSFVASVGYAFAIVVIASLVAVMLLPLHIPSGH